MFILGKMLEAIAEPRKELSPLRAAHVPHPDQPVTKIGDVIGPGGKIIRTIIEETRCTVDIEDDGTVFIGSHQRRVRAQARHRDHRGPDQGRRGRRDLHRQGHAHR